MTAPGDPGVDEVTRFRPVELASYWNNRAVSTSDDTGAGRFNVWRNSFPGEYLPEPGARVMVGGVPFDFPERTPAGDNLRCAGEFVRVVSGCYDWVWVLAASERRAEDTVALHFADGQVDFESIRISDFWAAPAWFGEIEAFRTPVMHYPYHVQPRVPASVWCQRIPVTRNGSLVGLRMPRNVALHVFAMTLQCRPPVPAR